jgi:DNA-binding NarL/FixJ family response regulator
MITIIIADDHTVFRQGLKRLLADDERFLLQGEGGSGSEALELIQRYSPDVAILDLAMPRPDGIEIAAALAGVRARTKCIILTMKDELYAVRRALDAGARGYLLKEAAYEEIAAAIVRVAAGQVYLGAYQDAPQLYADFGKGLLSKREEEILRQVARGLTSAQIGDELCISPRTVETHRRNIMEKLGIRTATALVNYAREQGLA